MAARMDTVERVVEAAVALERARMVSIAFDSGAVLQAMADRMGYTRARLSQLKADGERVRKGEEASQ